MWIYSDEVATSANIDSKELVLESLSEVDRDQTVWASSKLVCDQPGGFEKVATNLYEML